MAKKEQTLFNLGPWPFGQNSVQPENAALFQVRNPNAMFEEKGLGHLTKAVNVDFTDDGWPKRRVGTAQRVTVTTGLSAFSYGNILLFQDGANLYTVNTSTWATTLIATDFSSTIKYAIHGGILFGTDGTKYFTYNGTTVANWGLPIPTITATASAGAGLDAGYYLIQTSFSDAAGNEGGSSAITTVTTTVVNGRITINLGVGAITTGATHLNIYIGEKDQVPSFHSKVALGSLPVIITSITGNGDPPPADQLLYPPSSLVGLTSFRSFLLVWKDNIVFRSEAAEPHLFDPDNIFQFESTIKFVEGLEDGFWVGTATGIFWVSGGEDPASWKVEKKSNKAALYGSKKLNENIIQKIDTSENIVLFVAGDTLFAGLPGGKLQSLTEDRFSFSSATSCSIEISNENSIEKIIVLTN